MKHTFFEIFNSKKAFTLIFLLATISTLPWIGLGDFYTKGEPREAVLAISMIEKGEWIIPSNYADEFAYKPPFFHWMIAFFSLLLNKGEVTPFLSRLPSVLGFIGMIVVCFRFFSRKRSVLEASLICLILMTCFEIHRTAMGARIDMLLTSFLVMGIIQSFVWSENKKFYQLLFLWIVLGLAALTKGPVGPVIPVLILGCYLLTQRVPLVKAILNCTLIIIPPLLILSIWYYAAYLVDGDAFLKKVFAENIGRFLRIETQELGIDYNLGVENPWYYYPITLLAGFLPWTILLIVSLFFIKYKKPQGSIKSFFIKILEMDKLSLFSLIVIVVSLVFFTVPASKRSVYILYIYPFIAFFIARFLIYLLHNKPKVIRISTSIVMGLAILILCIVGLGYFRIVDLESFSHRKQTIHDLKIYSDLFQHPGFIGYSAILILLLTCMLGFLSLRKKISENILIAGFFIVLGINLFLDMYALPAFKNSYSSRPFAEYISKKYPDLKGNTYVLNNLLKYYNMYGLNFFLHNNFQNFEKKLPKNGYLLLIPEWVKPIKKEYPQYNYTLLETSTPYTDFRREILLFKITTISSNSNNRSK